MNQQSAQGLASLGRGPDSMLVHMAPGEVKSLQQLAMAHGGSLTINPETGLPEAGFLSSILPMIIGAGLTAATGGAAAPLIAGLSNAATIGLGVGGFQALRTGSLSKGLMAGLGAYGGAGLAGGLMNAGTTAVGQAAGNLAGPVGSGEFGLAANQAVAAQNPLQLVGEGAKSLLTEPGRTSFMQNIGGAKGLGMAGLAAAAPMMMETTTKQPEMKTDKDMGQRYRYSPGTVTPTPPPDVPGYENQGQNFGKEQRYFNPTYTPIDNEAARKLHGFASGGPVEAMSDANSIGMNTGYPQSGIRTGAYATPDQQPISRDMLPYPGQPQFAEGGEVGGYTYDPVTQMYTKKAGEGATMVSPVGGISGASGSSGSDQYIDPNPGWSNMTPTEKAEYYQDPANALMATITQLGQKGIGLTSLGMALNALDPSRQPAEAQIALGITPQQTFRSSEYSDPGSGGSDVGIGGSDISGQSEGTPAIARGGLLAKGGISHLGDYSDGGRLLRGPGDGISDSIPAMIGKKRPARLADGEFVVPARIVSELGNGSTEAGARKLYAMMDRVQKARKKTVGKGKVAANSRSAKYLPA
jgi:hypothetical protein